MDPAMDHQRMRETGRRLADGYLKDPPLLAFKAISELAGNSLTGDERSRSAVSSTNFPPRIRDAREGRPLDSTIARPTR
jgi:hypothetical protein